jgi:hypothetical protein
VDGAHIELSRVAHYEATGKGPSPRTGCSAGLNRHRHVARCAAGPLITLHGGVVRPADRARSASRELVAGSSPDSGRGATA